MVNYRQYSDTQLYDIKEGIILDIYYALEEKQIETFIKDFGNEKQLNEYKEVCQAIDDFKARQRNDFSHYAKCECEKPRISLLTLNLGFCTVCEKYVY